MKKLFRILTITMFLNVLPAYGMEGMGKEEERPVLDLSPPSLKSFCVQSLLKSFGSFKGIIKAAGKAGYTEAVQDDVARAWLQEQKLALVNQRKEIPTSGAKVYMAWYTGGIDAYPAGDLMFLCQDHSMKYKVQLYDVANMKVIKKFNMANLSESFLGGPKAISYSSINKYLIAIFCCFQNTEIRVWNAEYGGILKTYRLPKALGLVNISPNGRYIAFNFNTPMPIDNGGGLTHTKSALVEIFDIETGKFVWKFEGHENAISSFKCSPDSQYVASGSEDKKVKIWNVQSGECVRTFSGHKGTVSSLEWSPDGKYVASGSVDETVKIWDAQSGVCIRTFLGHKKIVWALSWSPDGRYIASGGCDRAAKIWDLESGSPICVFNNCSKASYISWSPGNKSVVFKRYTQLYLYDMQTSVALNKFKTSMQTCQEALVYEQAHDIFTSEKNVSEKLKLLKEERKSIYDLVKRLQDVLPVLSEEDKRKTDKIVEPVQKAYEATQAIYDIYKGKKRSRDDELAGSSSV